MTDQANVDTAIRSMAADDVSDYDNVAILLHWATALLVLFQFASAVTWDWFAKPTRETMQGLHVSFGALLTAVIFVRIVWRLIPGHQRASIVSGWMQIASKAVHYFLYLLLVVQTCLGFALRWAQGQNVEVFGLFGIPSPFAAIDKAARHTIHDLHEKAGWLIIIIAVGHALAALYHHYRLHDRVLGRMFPPARRTEGS